MDQSLVTDFILLSPIHFLIFIQLLLKFLGSRKENDVLIMNLPANFVLSCSTHLLYILFFFFFLLQILLVLWASLPSPIAFLLPPQVDCCLIFGVSFSIRLFITFTYVRIYLEHCFCLLKNDILHMCPSTDCFLAQYQIFAVRWYVDSLIFNC